MNVQKLRKKYNRVCACSSPSLNQLGQTLRSRNLSRESYPQSSEEPLHLITQKCVQQEAGGNNISMVNTFKSNVEADMTVLVGDNLQTTRKTKRLCKNSQYAFNNTIVLAPFHALKECFQDKLRDLYGRGELENVTKKTRLPETSSLQYEVWQMKAGETSVNKGNNVAHQEKEKQQEETTPGKKKSPGSGSEYCHCNRSGKRTAEVRNKQNKSGDTEKSPKTNQDVVSAPTEVTNDNEVLTDQPPAKKTKRNENKRNTKQTNGSKSSQPKNKAKQTKKTQKNKKPSFLMKKPTSNNIESGRSRKKSKDVSPENEEDSQLENSSARNQRKAQSKGAKKTLEIKYRTRSVTRKEALQIAEDKSQKLVKQKGSKNATNVSNTEVSTEAQKTDSQTSSNRTTNSNEIIKSQKALDGVEGASKVSIPINKDLSVLIVEEVQLNNSKTIVVVGSEDEECTCSSNKQSSKPEQNVISVSEVTKMFGTLLNEQPNEVKKCSEDKTEETLTPEAAVNSSPSSHHADNPASNTTGRNSQSKSSDHNIDKSNTVEDKVKDHAVIDTPTIIEPTVIVQHWPYESSSSDHISFESRKHDDSGTVSNNCMYETNMPSFNNRMDKSSTYIFGPKNPFEQLRESCEYGFGMPQTLSDDDSCETRRNLEPEKHK